MQHPNLQGSEFTGEEIDSGNHSGADATPRIETDDSVLRQLVTASKEAEGVIACLFELHFISAVPLEHIWELPVWWHFSVLVRARDKETLRTRRARVISLLKEIGSFGITEKRNLKAAFFSLLPGHDRFYARRALLGTANAGDLLSAYVLYKGDNDPVDYLQDRLHGVFAYNPFTSRERAHHRAICGPTVGGKSFFVIKDLLSHLIVNPTIWVVDLSASYLDLFELLREEMPSDTAIMCVSRNGSSFQFNPFLPANPEAAVPVEQFEFCMGLLKLMAGAKLTTPGNEMAMRRGLAEFLNAYRILLRNQQKRTPIPPITLLASILEMEIHEPELASAYALWTVGRRGELFNTGKDTLKRARYCYFDLRDLDGERELMTAIVYVIFSKVYRDIADEGLRPVQKRFVLDEAHRYITDPAFSHWIALLARTGRHWNIMLDLITQSLADLDSPDQPWSKAIITNLKQAFFFPGQKDVEASFRKLQLTAYHIEQYKKLDPSRYDVLYWSDGGLRRMLRSVADPYTYWLAATDPRERAMKRRIKELHDGNVRSAIEELVRLTSRCRGKMPSVAPTIRWAILSKTSSKPALASRSPSTTTSSTSWPGRPGLSEFCEGRKNRLPKVRGLGKSSNLEERGDDLVLMPQAGARDRRASQKADPALSERD